MRLAEGAEIIVLAMSFCCAGWLSAILADLNWFHFFDRLLFMALKELPRLLLLDAGLLAELSTDWFFA